MKKLLLGAAAPLLLASTASFALDYEVTVTNLTYGQVLTPPLVIAHKRSYELFSAGDTASAALKTLAETGNPAPLAESVMYQPDVLSATPGAGVIPPGQSMTVIVDARGVREISVVGMLATTNDAIYAAQGISVRGWNPSADAVVYDAGTEANTELCQDLPGPPCGGAMNYEVTEGAEGFIHMHRGFHGVNQATGDQSNEAGDFYGLKASDLDWRGPAAKIQIRRVH